MLRPCRADRIRSRKRGCCATWRRAASWYFAAIAHLNHHVRGADADADAAFCRELAERLGVPAIIGDADVPADAKTHQVSIEVAGRHARRQFFQEAIDSIKADRVAVAHTRDDQAETVILRLARGAGSSGLAAMAPRRDHVIRPLLDVDAIGAAGFSPRDAARHGAKMRPISIAPSLAIASATR